MSVSHCWHLSKFKGCFLCLFIITGVCFIYLTVSSNSEISTFLVNVRISDIIRFSGIGGIFLQKPHIFHFRGIKWRQTSLYEIFDRHKLRTGDSCVNICDSKKDMGCAATDIPAWQKLMLSPEFKFLPLLSEHEYIYPFEADYLSYPPMTDSKQLPNLTMSKVYIEGSGNGEIVCAIGDILKGRVDLVDGYGKQRIIGGDEVRVWMVDKQTRQYKAAGHVTDFRNGSYQISVRCLWPGTSQVSICFATPNIPGRPCVCNLTSVNQQSLYCGRPLDSREMSKNTIPHNINIVVKNAGQLPTLKPCSQTSPADTWEIEQRPRGYWTPGNDWQSLICERPKMTAEWTMSCLRNTSLWVFGDSNGVRLSEVVSTLTKVESNPGSWPYQFTKSDKINGINFTFTPLEYPVYLGQVWRPRLPYGGVAKQIDNIPSNGTHVLVIHYYCHIMPSHLNIAYFRLTAARDAIQRLINRNPNVTVGIRGPHVSSIEFNDNHAVGGDNLGTYFLKMIRDVFAELRHKVILLDGWGMSVALENSWIHPHDCVPEQLMRTLLAFKCS